MATTQAVTRLREVLRRMPPWPGEGNLERFLNDLALYRHVAGSTQNPGLNPTVVPYQDVLVTPSRKAYTVLAKQVVHANCHS
jgi:hypothetical protein